MTLEGRDLLTLADFSTDEVHLVVERAKVQKRLWTQASNRPRPLHDRAVAIIMLKPSLRTRVSFEIAVNQLGGQPVSLGPEAAFTRDESLEDTVHTLERFVDCIVLRTFDQSQIARVAEVASIPVVNALTDDYHPCQVLADLLTIDERFGQLEGLKLAYVGDGNNMANTLMIGCAHAGISGVFACPEGHDPLMEAAESAYAIAQGTGASLSVVRDPVAAVSDADVVYTDTWVSMGEEAKAAEKVTAFEGFQVTPALMTAAKPSAIFMHCLPAHRGYEVAPEVIDGPQSVVFEQAGNRMRAQKALLSLLLATV